MIGKCKANCNHAGQDALHGKGNRVLNEHPKKDRGTERKCTVCGTTAEVGGAPAKEAKK
jgi:hypothetical protein